MKFRHLLPAALIVAMAAMSSARAETVLYNNAVVVQGQQGFVQSFDITTAGTLTFSVSSFSWLDTVTNMTSFLSTATGVVGTTLSGANSESISVAPGVYYAHWFGNAQGSFNEGVLGVNIQFQPNGTTVPLPRSMLLLLSGLGLLFGWQLRLTPRPNLPATAHS